MDPRLSAADAVEVEAALAAVVRHSTLPVALLDLQNRTILAMSESARRLLGLDGDETNVSAPLLAEDPEAPRQSFALVLAGRIDGYEANRRLRLRDGSIVDCRISLRSIAMDGLRRFAISVYVSDQVPAPLREEILESTRGLTVGSVDAAGRVERISTDIRDLLGPAPESVVGHDLLDLVHPDDANVVREAFRHARAEDAGIAVRVQARNQQGEWQRVRIVAAPIDDTRYAFTMASDITVDARRPDRVARLEQHLWRIAREVEAAGVIPTLGRVPDPSSLPGLSDLSTRQWEVVTRLLRGERVSTIARELYLSPSTVRNHLAAIYRKVGVRSQTELVELLQQTRDGAATSS
jgi:PAS domain S-box-containing protein